MLSLFFFMDLFGLNQLFVFRTHFGEPVGKPKIFAEQA